MLPPDLDCVVVLNLLIRLLQTPQASDASLAKSLQTRGFPLVAQQVRDVVAFYRLQRDDSLTIAKLVARLGQEQQTRLQDLHPPDGLSHRFEPEGPKDAQVVKTTHRQVTTMELSTFAAVEVIHRDGQSRQPSRPSQLQGLVPKGGRYGYDLIARVGWDTFVKGRTLEDVQQDLHRLDIPFSSLYDLQLKFLFYLGHFHCSRAARLREYLQELKSPGWLIDSTTEADAPAFFGVQDAMTDLMLAVRKMPTENADYIAPCLKETSGLFGQPGLVWHDLGDAMYAACQEAWKGAVKHAVCHFHLVRDIGKGLLDGPNSVLRELVRKIGLQSGMKEQRNGQTDWLRDHMEAPETLAQMLKGAARTAQSAVLQREVLVAFHQWLLDYAKDGGRQGYPFNPHLLYFHRRVVKVNATMQRLLAEPVVQEHGLRVMKNFGRMLQDYLGDQRVKDAAQQYEEGYGLFCRLRDGMRMSGQGNTPLSERYLLSGEEAQAVAPALQSLREGCRQASKQESQEWRREQNLVVVEHLDRYWEYLFGQEGKGPRTTNGLERSWGGCKRNCRQRQGNKKLTLAMRSLPAEVMLVGNLEKPAYIEVMLDGQVQDLAKHLADAGRTAGPWTRWRNQHRPLNTARLPPRVLRQENLIDSLVTIYRDCCLSDF